MKTLRLMLVVTFALFSASVAFAGEEEAPEIPMPEPTAEHKVLEMWVGKWNGTAELQPGPFGPGGPMTWTEECSWFAGAGFNVVCKSKGSGPMGPSIGMGIMGYNPAKKVYTHYGLDSSGWAGFSEGTRSGDTWTFQSTETMEGKTYHSRFTMTMSPTEMTFTWEMSEDGENWMAMMEGTSKKG